MKPLALLLIFALAGCSTTGPDAATNARNAKLNATGSYVMQRTVQAAIDVAFQSVLNLAQSQSDSVAKSDQLDGFALALRSQEGKLLTSTDVQTLASIWLPQKPHWVEFGAKLAGVYAQANPNTPTAAKVALESIATGLNATSAGP